MFKTLIWQGLSGVAVYRFVVSSMTVYWACGVSSNKGALNGKDDFLSPI